MPTEGALLAQLKELNERSRTYARQFWQVPFAYVAASAVALVQIHETPALRIALLGIGGVGIFTVWPLVGVYRAAANCFRAMKGIEAELHLPTDGTKWMPCQLWALVALTGSALLASWLMAICLFVR